MVSVHLKYDHLDIVFSKFAIIYRIPFEEISQKIELMSFGSYQVEYPLPKILADQSIVSVHPIRRNIL